MPAGDILQRDLRATGVTTTSLFQENPMSNMSLIDVNRLSEAHEELRAQVQRVTLARSKARAVEVQNNPSGMSQCL
jgi:hypothetical protein